MSFYSVLVIRITVQYSRSKKQKRVGFQQSPKRKYFTIESSLHNHTDEAEVKPEVKDSHCALRCLRFSNAIIFSYLILRKVMSDLLDQINEADGKLQCLLDRRGALTQKEELLVHSLEAKLASLRSLQLVEAQRG